MMHAVIARLAGRTTLTAHWKYSQTLQLLTIMLTCCQRTVKNWTCLTLLGMLQAGVRRLLVAYVRIRTS